MRLLALIILAGAGATRSPYAVAIRPVGPAVPIVSPTPFSLHASPDGGVWLALGDAGFDRAPLPIDEAMTTERYLAFFEPTRCDGGVAAPAPLWSVPKELIIPVLATVTGCSDADERRWVPPTGATLAALTPIPWVELDQRGTSERFDWPEFAEFDFAHRNLLFTREVVTEWSVFEAPNSRARPITVRRVVVHPPYDWCRVPIEGGADAGVSLQHERVRDVDGGFNAVFELGASASDVITVVSEPRPRLSNFCAHDLDAKLVRSAAEAKQLGLDPTGVDFAQQWLAYFPPGEPLHHQTPREQPGAKRAGSGWALRFEVLVSPPHDCRPHHLDDHLIPHGFEPRVEPLTVGSEWLSEVYRVPAGVSRVRAEFPLRVEWTPCPDLPRR